MGKLALGLTLLSLLLLLTSEPVKASMVTVTPEGKLIWNVLSDETSTGETTSNSYIEVKKVADEGVSQDSSIRLAKNGDKISMSVVSGNETRELNLTQAKSDLVEIEERPQVEKLLIGYTDGKFVVTQGSIVASTQLPLNINAKLEKFSVTTPTGEVYLGILPKDAVATAMRTKLLTKVNEKDVEIENTKGELQYKVTGEKIISLLDVYDYSIPVTAYISAVNGGVVNLDSPTWFRYLRFLYL